METNNPKNVKENKQTFSHKVGDAVERAGEKVQEKGFKKTGEAISRAGDKIEHLQDKK